MGLRKINRTDGIRQEQHDRRDHQQNMEVLTESLEQMG
jgi:hypothetical protein